MRLFLDANILFSAAKTEGAVHRLLHLLREKGHELVVDGYVIAEARRNLEVKFPGATDSLQRLLGNVSAAAKAPPPLPPQLYPELPEKDRPVLAAAILQRCDVLLTGDKTHFGSLYGKTIAGMMIHSPATLMSSFTTTAR